MSKREIKSMTLILVILMVLISLSCVSAQDISDISSDLTISQADDSSPISSDVATVSQDTEVISSPGDKNFTVLQNEIDTSPYGMITLDSNYVRADGESDIVIDKNFNIFGNDVYTIDGNNGGVIFKINQGSSVLLSNVVLVNGNGTNGGAIYNEGTVNIISSTLTSNNASFGGAIYNKGIATISGSTLDGNTATTQGGAVYSTGHLVVDSSTFENNEVTTGSTYAQTQAGTCNGGGAIYNEGNLEITGSTFNTNTAPHDTEIFSAGGAIYNMKAGTLLIDDCKFEENSAVYGGAVMFENFTQNTVAIKDSVFNNNEAWQGGAVNGNDLVGSLVVTGSNFTENKAVGPNAGQSSPIGGAFMIGTKSYTGIALNVSECNFVDNDGGYMGGAIASSPNNNIKVADSNFTGNTATTLGGAIVTGTGTTLTVEGSTFTNNRVNSANGMGGAIFVEPNTDVTITDSTFTGNVDLYPSAIMNYQGTLDLSSNTFDDASVFNYGTITSQINVVVLDNGTATTNDGIANLNATITDDNGNVIRDSSLNFIINDEQIAATYDAVNKIFTATYTLPSPGVYTVSAVSTKGEEYTVKNGTVKNYRGTFTDLASKVATGGTLDLTYDFTYDANLDGDAYVNGVVISSPISIDGKGYTISGSNLARIFNVTADNVVLDNITFVNGSAVDQGGAIYSTGGLTITNSVFDNNKITTGSTYAQTQAGKCNGGGAIYAEGSLTVTGSNFTKNTAPHDTEVFSAGGAIYKNNAGTLLIDDCKFEENSAVYGGAVMFENFTQNTVAIKDSVFNNNEAWQGGAVNANDLVGSLIITGSNFTANKAVEPNAGQATPNGGAIVIGTKSSSGVALDVSKCNFNENTAVHTGGAISVGSDNEAVVTDSNFTANTAKIGGALYNWKSDLTVTDSNFEDNTADWYGGAIFGDSSDNTITGSTFTNNGDFYGAAIYSMGANLALSDNSITSEKAGIFNDGGKITTETKITVLDNTTVPADSKTANLYATVTDGNGNVIRDTTFEFVINGENVAANFVAAENLYKATYTLPGLGLYPVTMTSTKDTQLTVKPGEIEYIAGTYTDLQRKIDAAIAAGEELDLTYDFAYDADIDGANFPNGVIINEEITINGNDHSIDGAKTARIFYIGTFADAKIKGVVFKNGTADKGGALFVAGKLDIDNCTFIDNVATNGSDVYIMTSSVVVVNGEESYNYLLNDPDSSLNKYYNDNPREDGIDANGNPVHDSTTPIVGHSFESAITTWMSPVTIDGKEYTWEEGYSKFPWILINTNAFTGYIEFWYDGELKFNWTGNTNRERGVVSVLEDLKMPDYTLIYQYGTVRDKEFDPSLLTVKYVGTTAGKPVTMTSTTSDSVTIKNSVFNGDGNSIYNLGKLALENNTMTGIIYNNGTLTSQVNSTVLDNKTWETAKDTYILNATLTDDKGNKIYDPNLKFKVNDDEVAFSSYENGLYACAYPITFEPKYVVDVTSTTENELSTKTGTIKNLKIGTYTDLAARIADAILNNNSVLYLPYDFEYTESVDGANFINGIEITNDVSIYGKGYAINGNNTAKVFKVTSSTLTLNDVVIANGTTRKVYDGNEHGAAVYVSSGASLVAEKVTFANNTAYDKGGAIYTLGDVTIKADSIFFNNTASAGGAIYAQTGANLNIAGAEFTENYANNYGAIYSNGIVTITGSSFTNNSAKTGEAGAIILTGPQAAISSTTFRDNKAVSNGGAIVSKTDLTIGADCKFINNTANIGGAIYSDLNAKGLSVTGSEFINNSAKTSDGGAIYYISYSKDLTVSNSNFTNNTAGGWAGAIYSGYKNTEISGSVFKGNKAEVAGAVYATGEANIQKSEFIENEANGNAGALFYFAQTGTNQLTVSDNTNFTDNKASGIGGAILLYNGNAEITANFTGNNADVNGSAVYIKAAANANIHDSTFTDNGAATDYAIYNLGTLALNGNTMSNYIYSEGTFTSTTNVTVLEAKTVKAKYGQTVILNATYTDYDGNPIYDPNFNFTVQNVAKEIPFTKYEDGIYTATYKVDKVEQKEVSADLGYTVTTIPGILDISKANVVLTITANDTIMRKENETITIKLVDEFDNLLNLTVDVVITNLDTGIEIYTISPTTVNGTYSFNLTYSDYEVVGNYEIFAEFVANENYTRKHAVKNFDVVELDVTGTFTELQKLINDTALDTIILSHNITYTPFVDDDYDYSKGIVINRDVTIDGNGTYIDADKAHRILYIEPGVTVTIKNLTFKNGFADIGAAILTYADSLTISACNFIGNDPVNGSALNVQEGNVLVDQNSLFENNTATEYGGAIYVNAGASLTVNGAKFKNNTAAHGGAIYAEGNLVVNDATFTENIADVDGGAICIDATNGAVTYSISGSEFTKNAVNFNSVAAAVAGGAVYTEGAAKGTISGSTFTGNNATKADGRANGGAVKVQFGGEATITDCVFTDNLADKGAAIDLQANTGEPCAVTVIGCTFTDNEATLAGGAIAALQNVGNSELTVTDSKFEGNTAPVGGAIYIDDLSTASINANFTSNDAGKGGAIYALGDLSVSGSNFTKNIAKEGGAIYTSDKYGAVDLRVSGSTFTENVADEEGGAICIDATNGKSIAYEIVGSEFTKNAVNFNSVAAAVAGGAVYTEGAASGTISGSTFTGNNATKADGRGNGGAVKVQFGGEATIEDCVFTDNLADKGAAIDLQANTGENCAVSVEGCTFTDNEATLAGGAIALLQNVGNSELTVTDSEFEGNTAPVGGAIYIDDLSTASINANFTGNDAPKGGAIYALGDLTVKDSNFTKNTAKEGAAIYANDKYKAVKLTVEGSNFTENVADEEGGAICIDATNGKGITYEIAGSEFTKNAVNYNSEAAAVAGGAVYTEGAAKGTISGSTFTGNNATKADGRGNGGAVKVQFGGEATIEDCVFTDNLADKGAAIDLQANTDEPCAVTVTGSTFKGNHATQVGGAISALQNVGTSTLTVTDSVFNDNTADMVGGAIYIDDLSTASITGSEFTGNTGDYGFNDAIYSIGTLSLEGNEISNIIYNGGNIVTYTNITVLENDTYPINKDTYELNATLTDDNGNKIYDKTFKFVVNNQLLDQDVRFDFNTGVYTTDLTIGSERKYVVNGTADREGDLHYFVGILINIKGTYTDLQNLIDAADGTLALEYNFTYTPEIDGVKFPEGVLINKPITIDGKGFTISGNNSYRIFKVNNATVLNNITFVNGSAVLGGAIYANSTEANITVTILNSTFVNNTAVGGGALAFASENGNNVSYYIIDSLFENNVAVNPNGLEEKSAAGGAILSTGKSGWSYIGHTTFKDNKAMDATMPNGGAVKVEYGGKLVIANAEFEDNYAEYTGGAIDVQSNNDMDCLVIILNSSFKNNKADVAGAAIAAVDNSGSSTVVAINSTFENNVINPANAVYISSKSRAAFINSTFTDNGGATDYAIYNLGGLGLINNTVSNIIYTNSKGGNGIISTTTYARILNNDTYDITSATYELNATLTDDNGNKIYDPNLAFTVNGVPIEAVLDYNKETGLYTYTFDITDERIYVVNVTADSETKLNTEIGILRNILGTYTDLQKQIDAAGATLVLPYDFAYTAEIDGAKFPNGVVIDKEIAIDGDGYTISGNNSYRIFNINKDAALTLSDVTLTNGSAQMGGAIYMVYDSELNVEDVTFVNNTAAFGGAIYTNGVRINIDIKNSEFINNTVTDVGGAIVVTGDDDNVTITGSTFKSNKAEGSPYGTEAGAIWVQDINSLKVEDCEFINNSADDAGAINIFSYADPVFEAVITGTEFINNTANDGSGGAIWSNVILTIEDSLFENNTATTAGALYIKGATTIDTTNFVANEATGNGGAIFFHGGDNTLTISDNTIFTDNKAGNTGGAILVSTGTADVTATFTGNEADVDGNAVYIRANGNATIKDSTFTNNGAATDYAIYNLGTLELSGNSVDNIIYNGGLITSQTTATVIGNDTYDITAATYDLNVTLVDDSDNVIYDPSLKFTVNGAEVDAIFDPATGYYYYDDYDVSSERIYVVNVTATGEENLVTKYGILRNILGTYTDLQKQIDAAGATLVLPYDFAYTEDVDGDKFPNGVVIDKEIAIDGDGYTISGNNSYRIFNINKDAALTLSDVTLTNGSAQMGGAIYMVYDSELNVEDVTFVNNTAAFGGAIYTNGVRINIDIKNSEFINNTVTDVGGAIVVTGDDDNVTITGSTFKSNKAEGSPYGTEAGAIWVQDINSLKVDGCEFINNSADDAGAINIFSYADPVFEAVITGTEFINNTANDGSGGAIWSNVILTIEDSLFENNTATTAGALYIKGATTIDTTNFIANEATGNGGAIFFYGEDNTLTIGGETNFADNKAGNTGGAILISKGTAEITAVFECNNATNSGGAIHARDGTSVEIIGSEFTSNKVTGSSNTPSGGAVYIGDAKANITDSTFTANEGATSAGAVYIGADNAIINNTEFENNKAGASAGALWVNGYDVQVIDSTFTGNKANDAGGAIVWATKNGILTGSSFKDNTAGQGGAVCWLATNGTISDSQFYENNATQNGGAVFWAGSNGTIKEYTVFYGNQANENGNAIYWSGANGVVDDSEFGTNTGGAGAILWSGANGLINGSSFSDNGNNLAVFNIYKLADDLTISNNQFVINIATIKTDKSVYAYGENVTVSGEFYWGVNDYPINLTFSLDKDGSYLEDVDTELTGVPFSEVLEKYNAGTYVAYIDFFKEAAYGNVYVIIADPTTEFEIEKANATLVVTVGDDKKFAYGDNVTVFIELYNNNTLEGITANITVIIDDTPGTVEVINGSASFNVTGFQPGQYAVMGEFDDENYNGPIYNSDVFEVLRPDRILSIEVEDIKYGDIAIINITVTDSEGNKEKGVVSLNVSGKEIVVIVDGNKSVEIEGLPVGEYLINATLMETEVYAEVINDTESFNVTQAASIVEIISVENATYPDDVVVTIKVENATEISVNITQNGAPVEATVVVSEDTITISGLGVGEYAIKVTNAESESYTGSVAAALFNVSQATPVISVTADDVTYNADVVVTVVSDASGTATVSVGGQTVTDTVEAGVSKDFIISGLAANEEGYAIAVSLAETQNYTAGVNDTESVKVMKAASSVKIYSTSITTYPDDVFVMFEVVNATEIAVNVYDANGAEITKGITLDDGIVIISDLAAGEYTIVITNAGSDNYIESYDQAAFEVYKATVTIKPVATGDMVVDGEVNITFTVPKDIDGMLNVTIDGETVVVVTVDENGTVTIPDTYNYAGKHTVIVTLTGDTNYNDATGTTTFDIAKVTPVITINDVEATVGDTVEATVTIDGGDATGFILYDGVYYPVENGQATIPVTVTTAGPNTIAVFYTGDEKYGNGTADNTFNASKAASTIKIIGDSEITTIEDTTVIITVGPEGVTGGVIVTLDGENYGRFQLENGVVTLENITLTAGNHTFAANYTGDDNYNASDVATWNITVSLAPTEMEIVTEDAVYGETAYIEVFGLPEDATGTVTAIIGGKEFSADVEDGVATIEVTGLAADEYEFEVTYSGDSTYAASSEMATIDILRADSTVEIDDIDDVVYNASVEVTFTVENETDVTVTVYDADGTEITEGITLEDGKVIIAGLDAGEYTIEISNAGDKNHTESSDIASFNVLKADANINVEANGTFVVDGEVNITFTVPKDYDGDVTVLVDGNEVIGFIIDENGTCTIPLTFDAGEHIVTVTLTDDTNYDALPGTTTFNITKVNPKITYDDIVGNVGDTVEVNVTIAGGDATGYVFFDGDLYTVKDGKTTILVDIETAGMQFWALRYTGDDKYNDGFTFIIFNAGKAASTIEIDGDKEITTVDDAVVIVTVGPEGVTGTVDITVDGEPYGEPVDVIDGVAMAEISGLTAGNHTIAAQYTGNYNYNASEIAEMNVTVSLAPTDMDLEVIDAVYGETAYVIVSGLPEDATGNVTVTIGDNTFTAPVEDGLAVVEITGLAADEYEFEVSYSGDDKYEAASDGDTIEITPAASSVEIDDIDDVVYNESVEVSYAVENATDVTVTVYDADGSEITEGITVDDDKVIIAGLDAGEYTIVIYNAGDENHTESADMATFKVLKDTVIIEPDATGDMVVDGEVNITFTVPKDIDGILTVTIDGELVEFSVDDGTVTITDTYSAGPHTVVVTLSDDTNYEDETGSTTFEINKVDPVVTASDLNFTVDNEGILEITGPSDRQGNLIVSINGTDYAVALDRSGLGTLDVSGLAEGTYTVDITYIENDKYNAGEFTDAATITVNAKADTPITVKDVYIEVGETATVNAVVPAAINGQKVTISVNGEDRVVTVKDGKASARFTDLIAGEYEITVSYAGDNANAANSTTATLTVGKVAPETSIEATSVVAGNDVIITVTVPEDAIGTVYFDVDGKNYYALVEDGEATLILSDLPVGNYTVEYTYGGDDKYIFAIGDAEFEVSANDTYEVGVFSEPVLAGEDAVITVVMPEDATGAVSVTVDGETYIAPIVDGVATVTIPDMPAGEFDADVSYPGDDKYAPFSAETLVIVDKVPDAPMDVEADPVEAGEDAVVEVTLPEDATGEVTVTVDGKNYTAPVKDGKATVTVPGLPAGDYTADVTYSGDDKYEPVSDTAPISVDKVPDVPMDVEADPVEAGEDAVVEVTLPEDATGEVTVTVDGKNYTAPVKDGKATVTVPELPVGSYPATVSYSGDDKYDPVSTETPVTVNKVSDAPINASADPVEAGETAIIEVNLPEDATGAVVAEVDGELYAAEIESGYAEIFVPGLQSGNHTATVTYYGDDKYEAVNTTVTLTVGDLFEVFAPNVEKYYHGPERFNVYVLLNGEGVADKTVKITLNGVTYERTTDENGTASIGLNLNSGQTYNVTVKVDDIELNSTVTIKPTIVGTDVTKIYKNGTQYYATFYDREGNLLANTAVTFNINGVFYNRTTDANGVAKLNINLIPGEYIITAINPDSGEMISNTVTVLSQFIEHGDLVKVYGTSVPYVVKVRDKDGSIAAGQVVNFNINGVFYNRTSDSNGLVRLNINLLPGEYIITATYGGERVSDKVTVLAA